METPSKDSPTRETPRERVIPVSNLLVDVRNPRLPHVSSGQREAIRAMIEAQGEKIIFLAQHMTTNGPNPANLPIVMPAEDSEDFIVLDGNRRLVALKLLENPRLGEGIFPKRAIKRFKELSEDFHAKPIGQLTCVVVANRSEADTWIRLVHRGQNRGAGLVSWNGQVAARYDARQGTKSFALQALDFVRENATLSEAATERIEAGKFPITNLERLINTPYVREKLGIDKGDGELLVSYPEEEVIKGLTRIVEDLGAKNITVSDIKRQAQRIDYVNSFGEIDLPDSDKEFTPPRPLGESVTPAKEDTEEDAKDETKTRTSRRRPRTVLIPRGFKLEIEESRIRDIFMELKRLRLERFPNSSAVMLRVFVELSLDTYIEEELQWPEQKVSGAKLSDKLNAVANDLQQRNVLTKNQLAPIRKAAGGQTVLVSSIKSLHAYVHNKYYTPIPSELRTAWDDLEPFIEQLWETV